MLILLPFKSLHRQPGNLVKGKPVNINEESAFDKMDEDATQEAMCPKKLHIKGTLRDISRHLRHKREKC